MGGPEVEFHRGQGHPLLWMNAPRCRLQFPAPPPEPIAVAVALWAAHVAATENHPWPTVPTLPAPALMVQHLTAGDGYSLYGPEPLIQGYARALRRLGVLVECVVTEPHGQWIPGGDGEVYDPPLDLKLLLLDQSYVVAETFVVEDEDPPSHHHKPRI